MNGGFLSDKQYRVAKFVAQILLPAIGTLYFGLAAIWNLPVPEKVIGSITVVDTFLGIILGLSSNAYGKSEARFGGTIKVTDGEDRKLYSLVLNQHPDELDKVNEIVFKVSK